ncbi:microcin C ABC transporter permease YejB [Reyranella sp. CPCC 100927]|uniref:microcin C ABC transporter permease YejB n=1 Tax=Reyranella sp. CPCC 100927 TaxID=2599616 RepID=UPI0011B5142F|nr:microcin C ABC transporter permease YejB [Reyranella sp. CPCC 100927]TWT03072.1 microcin C ABC transporter permease YejB [Reyranella sp. CPCC 100927]
MLAYILRRLLLMVPTLVGILTLNFFIIQAAPGGPVDRIIAQLQGRAADPTARFSGGGTDIRSTPQSGDVTSRGARGIPPEVVERIKKQYGFDKPLHERYLLLLGNYATFNLGNSTLSGQPILELVASKLPVSISLGLWTTLLVYLISIPLGVAKAVRDGSRFDVASSSVVIVGTAIPAFLFAILLVVLFAGGSYWNIFPRQGLTSPDWDTLSTTGKILDYFWHLVLPIVAMVIGGFATLTMLTKNSFIDEVRKQYVQTARAKGLSERRVLYGHVFRNAMLLVIAGFPAAFISILFTGSLLIEVIFSLDGLGFLGFNAAINRDYSVIFGTLWIFSLLGLILGLIGDLMYVLVDPRIDFERRGA